MSQLYVYGITRSGNKKTFGSIGYFGKEVKFISEGDIAILASEYDQEIDLSKENLLIHMKVLDTAVSEGCDVLPLKFGTVAANEEEVINLLKSGYTHWQSKLERVSGNVELTFQMFWPDFDQKVQQLVEEDQYIADLRSKMLQQPSYRTQVTAGEIFKNIVEDKKRLEASPILDQLLPLSQDFKENLYLTDTNVANYSFLVPKSKVEEFDKTVKELVQKSGDKYLIKYYGPSAPFNFV